MSDSNDCIEYLSERKAEVKSDSIYEINSFKTLIPQVQGALTATSFNFTIALAIAFSGVLIPNIEKPDSGINVSTSETSLIAAAMSLAMTILGPLAGFFTDHFGPLTVLRLSFIPNFIGWTLIALASNWMMLLIGRLITGLGSIMAGVAAVVYVTEISFPKLRGALFITSCAAGSIGIMALYLKAFVMDWRAIAWCCNGYNALSTILTLLIEESPLWLVKKGQIIKAKRSLKWIHKYQTSQNVERNSETHLINLKHEDNVRKELNMKLKNKSYLSLFLKPTCYKPFLIVLVMSFIQQFSGIYVIQAYTITFFQNVGNDIDPLIASNIVTGLPVIVSFVNFFTVSRFGRKTLLIFSCTGASVSLFISGLFTKWIREGVSNQQWVPVFFIFFYMAVAIIGLEPLPWILSSELIPQELRGILLSVNFSVSALLMFTATYSYRFLDNFLGSAELQFFYGTIALSGVFYIYFFIPETQGKTLFEIENFFN